MATVGGARSVEQWRRYLAEYSADVLRTASDDDLAAISDVQRAARWLGFDGADAARLALLEQRLGTALPPSYRSFLAASDGWLNIGPFMWTMRTTSDVDWLREADPDLWDILRDGPASQESSVADRALLISGDGDAQYWLLDPGDVSPDGEWAAYIWASWYPGLGDRCESFAALVDAERESFEELSGRDGRPVHPAGADALVAEGRELALRGDVGAAADAFARAAIKGSGAGAYLAVILNGFLEPEFVHHEIRNNVLARPHVITEIGSNQLRAEAVPLFLRHESIASYRKLFTGILTEDEMASPDRFVPPVLPEPPAFQAALDRARQLLRGGSAGAAWAAVQAALPGWRSDSPHRIAPVILLTDPQLRHLITPDRARTIVTTPRGGAISASSLVAGMPLHVVEEAGASTATGDNRTGQIRRTDGAARSAGDPSYTGPVAGFEERSDPRLVTVDDSWDRSRQDLVFYADLAAAIPATSVVDLGCGAGRLAAELAHRGYQVTGIDPSPARLAVARRRDGGDLVRWVQGDASCLGLGGYDLAVMSGHVVQAITDNDRLMATFAAIHRALRPGGRFAFDSRNPVARAWQRWTPDHSRRTLPDGVEVWFQDPREHGDLVTFEIHYRFPDGAELVSHKSLRFRSYGWLRQALVEAGFQVNPVDYNEPDLIFIATSAPVRKPAVLRIRTSADGERLAAILYDSSETVTVPITGLDTTEVLQRLRDYGVPQDLVLAELEQLDLGWDVRDEIHQRSEADMADWRRLDQERREQLKRDFRRGRGGD